MRGVTAERSEISPDDRREESPKAMSIRGAERSEGIAEGEARVPSRSGADRSRGRRVVQDSLPTAYMYTPSGAKDAQIARPAQGAPLPRP